MGEPTLQEIFPKEGKYTFLVGAGCSIDFPSCLPAGAQMMEVMVKFSCRESEVKRIISLENLRFEQLVEILRDQLDPELKIIEYYDLCNKPNKIHLFLAKMMKHGHFVMTTNFDSLIEYALLQSKIKKRRIIPVITRSDFETYENPEILYPKKRFPVYKIHGSCKNIISGKSTKNSLIATIQAFGSGKEGESVFQLEPFKRSLFENISKNRSLVVMGYSGSDDFDIVPTLKQLKQLNQIIWIDHAAKGTVPEITRITREENIPNEDKVGRILHEINQLGFGVQIFRIKINTIEWIDTAFNLNLRVTGEPFSVLPMEYIQQNVKAPNILDQYEIPYKIYRKLSLPREAYKCAKIFRARLRMDENLKEQTILPKYALLSKEAEILTEIGEIHLEFGELKKARECFSDALQICEEEVQNLEVASKVYTNIGLYLLNKGDTKKALDFLDKSLKIDEKKGNLPNKSLNLQNIGRILRKRGDIEKAMGYFKEILKISEKLGNLTLRANTLIDIGISQKKLGDLEKALASFNESLKIGEKLGDLRIKGENLNNIGQINERRAPFEDVMETYKQALAISEQIWDLRLKGDSLINIGRLTELIGGEQGGLRNFKDALKIAEDLSDKEMEAICCLNIGQFYEKREKNLDEALIYYNTAASFAEKLEDLRLKSESLRIKGFVVFLKGEMEEAQKKYQESLEIAEKLDNKILIYEALGSIGRFWHEKGNLTEAEQSYSKALSICRQTGNIFDELRLLERIGKIFYENKDLDKSMQTYKEALSIAEKLKNLPTQADLLELIEGIYIQKNDLHSGLKYAESLLIILKKIGSWKTDPFERVVKNLRYRINSTERI